MKLKIVKVQKVSEIQTKSGFHGSNEASTDADGRARPVHPPTQETTWTTEISVCPSGYGRLNRSTRDLWTVLIRANLGNGIKYPGSFFRKK